MILTHSAVIYCLVPYMNTKELLAIRACSIVHKECVEKLQVRFLFSNIFSPFKDFWFRRTLRIFLNCPIGTAQNVQRCDLCCQHDVKPLACTVKCGSGVALPECLSGRPIHDGVIEIRLPYLECIAPFGEQGDNSYLTDKDEEVWSREVDEICALGKVMLVFEGLMFF